MKYMVSILFNIAAWAALLICWDIDVRQIEFVDLLVGMICFTILQLISDISKE